jgi:thiamine pyrophosphate-dependent acetolactate synthase large subunit-like protein
VESTQNSQHEQTELHTSALTQGGDLFFQAAQRYGYRVVFGNPGTTEAGFMDALARNGALNFVMCLFENVATGAADGFARIADWPAIVNLHLGPGLANGLSNIHNARQARSPMIVTVGQHDPRHLLQESPLASDIEALARVECKWVYTVQDASEMVAALHRATTIAMTPPRGPVCLVLPTNMLSAPARLPGSGETPVIPDYHAVIPGPASSAALEQAVELLQQSRHPLFIVGNIDVRTFEQVRKLARLCGAHVVSDTFPRRIDRPVFELGVYPYFPDQRRQFLSQYDTLFLIETGGLADLFYYEFDAAPVIPPQMRVIQLEDDSPVMGRNTPGALPLYGNASSSLDLLLALTQQRLGKTLEDGSVYAGSSVPGPTGYAAGVQSGPVSSESLMRALASLLPANTILADESVTARDVTIGELLSKETNVTTYLASKGASLGVALPLAIGAQLAAPTRPVVAITGDGSAMYTVQGLWTAAHNRLPILTIVLNNASYDVIKFEMLRWMQGHQEQFDPARFQLVGDIGNPRLDFVALAQGMGVQGWTVRTHDELLPHLRAALETCQQGRPALVDVHVVSPFG